MKKVFQDGNPQMLGIPHSDPTAQVWSNILRLRQQVEDREVESNHCTEQSCSGVSPQTQLIVSHQGVTFNNARPQSPSGCRVGNGGSHVVGERQEPAIPRHLQVCNSLALMISININVW